jgi:hypothetical protein
MNSITGILNRENITEEDGLNIVWTPADDLRFQQTIQDIGHNLLSFDHLYFGCDTPHLILCNNKIMYYEKCKNLSIQFHIPVLMVDHDLKPSNVSDEKATYDFPTSKNIAMSQRIADSWERQNYDSIIDNVEHAHSKNIWRKFIFQTTQTIFKYYG